MIPFTRSPLASVRLLPRSPERLGASGTGKELAAREIHQMSPRKDCPFVSFNYGGFTNELINSELFGYEKGAFTGATANPPD